MDGLYCLEWIEYFDTAGMVPPAKWDDPYYEVVNDIWLEWTEESGKIIEELIIVPG